MITGSRSAFDSAPGPWRAKSFVKRRLRIPPGTRWIPWDQVDFVLGALILVSGQAALSWPDRALILLLSAAGHVLVSHVGYWTGVRDVKW
jgi:CDP-2,3-bis-(O-geranylgeranyl)-sn-glycerol synthase